MSVKSFLPFSISLILFRLLDTPHTACMTSVCVMPALRRAAAKFNPTVTLMFFTSRFVYPKRLATFPPEHPVIAIHLQCLYNRFAICSVHILRQTKRQCVQHWRFFIAFYLSLLTSLINLINCNNTASISVKNKA